MAEKERKLDDLRQKVVKESGNKGLSINCKRTEGMVVNKFNMQATN